MVDYSSHDHGRDLKPLMLYVGVPRYDQLHMAPPNDTLDMKRLDIPALVCDVFD
jgi:hypothetical protein